MIRMIYHCNADKGEKPHIRSPKAQHPEAERYTVKSESLGYRCYVDATEREPTSAEVDAVLTPPKRTLDEKLAAIGLTREDMKEALS